MNQPASIIFSTFLAQAVGAILLSIVLLGFHRYYRRSYLLHWTWSWWALAVFLISGSIALYLVRFVPAIHPARLLMSGISQVAAYWQVAWLLFGAYEVAYNIEVPRSLSRRILLLTTALGVLSAVLFIYSPGTSASRYFMRVGVRALITGTAFAIASYSVWRRAEKGSLGPKIVAAAFLLYGLEQLHSFTALLLEQWMQSYMEYLAYLGFLSVVLQFVMGLGMVIWFLEVERERVVRASEQIEHMAYHDSLTRLPNRQLFLDRVQLALAQAKRSGKHLCVLFLDLDRFKTINDSLGHTAGDELLRAAAERIRRVLRGGDTVARLGGDEFTVLLPEANREEAGFVAQKLLHTVNQPFLLHDYEMFISTSIGIAAYPQDGNDAETLLKNADTAMYRAKELGRDTVQFFAPAMNARALERLSLENGLRKALPAGEFLLYYQPVVAFDSGNIRSVEALLRWNHPERGIVLPGEFLYEAEVCGIMESLNRWALENACLQVHQWQENHPGVGVAVNLSARFFQHPSLIEDVERALRKSGLAPEALTLEITETTAMQNAEASLGVLKELKQLGVRIAIDDFGTGYSSLSYLRTFPIDILKVDRVFVRDIHLEHQDLGIAGAIITLAHGLKIRVIAEGVETQEQHQLLKSKGCDEYQGYLFSRPIPAGEVERLFNSGEWKHARARVSR